MTAAAEATPFQGCIPPSQPLRCPGLRLPFSPPEPLPDPALPAWQARAPAEPSVSPSVLQSQQQLGLTSLNPASRNQFS